jgi:hypothetical protein
MINSVFFQILSSWEVIAAIAAFMIILPITFYIASHDKDVSLEFVGVRKKKIQKKSNAEENSGDGQNEDEKDKTGRRRRGGRIQQDDEDEEDKDEEKDKQRYKLLKRLNANKGKK